MTSKVLASPVVKHNRPISKLPGWVHLNFAFEATRFSSINQPPAVLLSVSYIYTYLPEAGIHEPARNPPFFPVFFPKCLQEISKIDNSFLIERVRENWESFGGNASDRGSEKGEAWRGRDFKNRAERGLGKWRKSYADIIKENISLLIKRLWLASYLGSYIFALIRISIRLSYFIEINMYTNIR